MPRVALPILMPTVSGQAWSCRSCARCCFDLVGHISEAERDRIDRQGWATRLDEAPYVRVGRSIVLNKHADGACVFLDRQTRLCRIHSEFGEAAKPLACRIYPFTVRPLAGAWQASVRFDCPSVAEAHGDAIYKHKPWLSALTGELPPMAASAPDCPLLDGETRLDEETTRRIVELLIGLMESPGAPMRRRVLTLAWVANELAHARLGRVGADRIAELMSTLVRASGGMAAPEASAPSARQSALMRELAFVHSEHATISQMNAGVWRKLARRIGQLRQASAMRRGTGFVPPLRGLPEGAAFEAVERVEPAHDAESVRRIDELMRRYLVHRFQTRSCFGPGYYDWTLVDGLLALAASLSVLGWLARVHAASSGQTHLRFVDVFEGLRIVDRSAGLSPALKTRTERLRLRYMSGEGGLVRLAARWTLTA